MLICLQVLGSEFVSVRLIRITSIVVLSTLRGNSTFRSRTIHHRNKTNLLLATEWFPNPIKLNFSEVFWMYNSTIRRNKGLSWVCCFRCAVALPSWLKKTGWRENDWNLFGEKRKFLKNKKSDAWVCGGSRACGAAVVGGGSRALLVAGGRGCCGSAAQPARLGHGQLAAAGGRGCRLPCETLLQPHTTRSRSDRGDSLHCQYIFREVCIYVSFLNSVNRYKTIQLL